MHTGKTSSIYNIHMCVFALLLNKINKQLKNYWLLNIVFPCLSLNMYVFYRKTNGKEERQPIIKDWQVW